MSGYYDDDYSRPRRSHRSSRRPVYEEEIIETRNGRPSQAQMDLVRRRDSDSDVEEVRRDFPPGQDGTYVSRKYSTRDRYAPAPRARSHGRYDDDTYSYASHRSDHRRRRRDGE